MTTSAKLPDWLRGEDMLNLNGNSHSHEVQQQNNIFFLLYSGKATRYVSDQHRKGRQGSIPLPMLSRALTSLANDPLPQGGCHEQEMANKQYLQLEKEAKRVRVGQFINGDLVNSRLDMEVEMKSALKRWKDQWRRVLDLESAEDDSMEMLELHWISRSVQHLYDELYMLNSVKRSTDYIDFVHSYYTLTEQ
jgi:hypothetical protein